MVENSIVIVGGLGLIAAAHPSQVIITMSSNRKK
jgi:hypothetical protein